MQRRNIKNSRLKRFLWFAVLFCGLVSGVSSVARMPSKVYLLPPVAKAESLANYIYYWEDQSANASLSEAKQALQTGKFKASGGNLNMGFTGSAYWFHVVFRNAEPYSRQLALENDYPLLDTVEVYCNLGQRQQYFLLGDHNSEDARPLKVRNFVIPFTLHAMETASCLFRIVSSSNVILPLSLSDAYPYVEEVHDTQWLLGAFYGIAFGLLLYNGVLFLALKERMYFFYALHCFGGILFNAGLDGSFSSFLIAVGLQDLGVIMAICIAQLGALYFSLDFLGIRESHARLYKVSQGIAVFIVINFLLAPVLNTRIISEIIVSSAFMLLLYLFFLGLLKIKDRYLPSWVFLLGWGPVIMAAMLVALTALGVFQDSAISKYSMKFAWCAELIVLSIGLGWRVREMKINQLGSEKQMLEARKESVDKTQFLAKVSHEVRGPMSGILGLSELLTSTNLDNEQRRYVKAIRNGSNALLEITNDFLDYSKIEAGKLSLTIRPFDLKDLVKDCAAIYEMAARKKGLKLVCVFEIGTPVVVDGDGGRVRQVLLNLVSNALKYTEIGYIKIRIGLTDKILDQQIVLRITVEDTGVGIDQNNVNQLFQNYGQLNQAVEENVLSTGLGLVISRQLVELMGGNIQFESQLGRGSSFWFTLPVSIKDDYEYLDHEEIFNLIAPVDSDVEVPIEYSQQALNHTSPNALDTPNNDSDTVKSSETLQYRNELNETQQSEHHLSVDLKILVVEDNDINLKVIKGFLDKLGLRPTILNNGLKALQHITEGAYVYDLILMDCEMPVMDGYTAAEKILTWQAENGVEKTPIVALSAHATDIHRQKALDAGMVMHIAKPLTFEKFTDAIDVVLG